MMRSSFLSASAIRAVSWMLLIPLVVFYTWFSFRRDGALMTVPGVPHFVWFYFDNHGNIRNGVGFLILSVLAMGVVAGLSLRWQVLSLALCLLAPVVKDFAQDLFAPTRHFNWDATALGTLGALVGWGAAAWFLRSLKWEG